MRRRVARASGIGPGLTCSAGSVKGRMEPNGCVKRDPMIGSGVSRHLCNQDGGSRSALRTYDTSGRLAVRL
jgi:hypothetical protein